MPNQGRAAYYFAQCADSVRMGRDEMKRGNEKAARAWFEIAEGEANQAEFWQSDESPLLDPEFDFSWRPPVTLATEEHADSIGAGWTVRKQGVAA